MIRLPDTCRVCDNGDLVLSRLDDGRVVAECLECMTGYTDPADLEHSEVLRLESGEWRTAPVRAPGGSVSDDDVERGR